MPSVYELIDPDTDIVSHCPPEQAATNTMLICIKRRSKRHLRLWKIDATFSAY